MIDNKFYKTSEYTWVTRSISDYNLVPLINLRWQVLAEYKDTIIKIIEDHHSINYEQSAITSIRQAFSQGVDSLTNNTQALSPKYYFLQITFLDDADNANFILKMSDPEYIIVKKMNEIQFYM
jgi:hypothetical protein